MDKPQKYRAKPEIVQAMQFDGTNGYEILKFFGSSYMSHVASDKVMMIAVAYSTYKAVELRLNVNDWVIQDVHGFFHRIAPDIFDKLYERANSISSTALFEDRTDLVGEIQEMIRQRHIDRGK